MIDQKHTAQHEHLCTRVEVAVSMQSVNLYYEEALALKDISLSIPSGARVALVGPNGAGKSSLLHLIAGVAEAASGEISVHGHPPARFLCTAYVTQNRSLDWDFPVSVADVVMMGRTGQQGLFRRVSSEDRQIVDRSLERLGILSLANRQIGELSGGQKQRMFIARALAQGADLFLLDEPLAGLDLASKEKIFHILDELREAGSTVLVATHDLNLAEERFDQILLLNQKLIGFGSGDEVLIDENLAKAYGGHVQIVEAADGRKLFGDMGGHHHHHDEGSPHG